MKSTGRGLGLPAILLALLFVIVYMFAGCGSAAPPVEMTTVPDLASMSAQEARSTILEAGLEVGDERDAYSDTVPDGEVISTSPSSGEELEKGSAVDLVVSKGPEMIAIPSLVGTAEADALAALQSQGFQAEVVRSYNESLGAGLVCGMDPASGATAAPGSKIVVTVSLGSAYVTCGTCGGNGSVTTSVTCPDCGGSGVCYT